MLRRRSCGKEEQVGVVVTHWLEDNATKAGWQLANHAYGEEVGHLYPLYNKLDYEIYKKTMTKYLQINRHE